MTQHLLNVSHISKTYEPYPRLMRLLLRASVKHSVRALDDVSFSVATGEIVAVVGPNGAGKSTLFRILTGLTTPTAGFATMDGLDVAHESTKVRALLGFSPAEERTLLLRHTCRENLDFHGKLQDIDRSELPGRVDAMLDRVGLAGMADRTGFALSSGMRARLQLARALLHDPKLVILDEPTGAIDPLAARDIVALIKETAARGITVLLSSHRLEEIEALGKRVLLMDRGRTIYDGDLEHLRAKWDGQFLELTFVDAATARMASAELSKAGIESLAGAAEETILVSTEIETGPVLSALDNGISKLASLSKTRRPLVDVLSDVVQAGRGAES